MDTNTETDHKYYRSDDLLISSFLLCKQARLIDIIADSRRHFVFIFQDPARCNQLVQEYINGASAVARDLFAMREQLLTQMRNRDGGNYGNSFK